MRALRAPLICSSLDAPAPSLRRHSSAPSVRAQKPQRRNPNPANEGSAQGAAMASKTLSISSLASTAFASLPRSCRPPRPPPLLRLLGPRLPPGSHLRASPLSAAADADDGVDNVEQLLLPRPSSSPSGRGRIDRLMKLQRRADDDDAPSGAAGRRRWFPYLDAFRSAGGAELSSREVVEVLEPHILEPRRDRIRCAVDNRSYAVCLVVEGLTDFGNVSAAFRSADALGVQSVHVISCDNNKRYRDNRHVSMGAEKWLDIELWNSPAECFSALKKRGYRIATTCLGTDSVSVYDMDWSQPTAIVVGNELRVITVIFYLKKVEYCLLSSICAIGRAQLA
ncbi:uncharacterized protein LOC133891489 isoform X2 [Phragmites australis]|uniref:uncharacterized protein LOC133891489 isoform X2 n=1 Tax=Phragmites australis TaxID=29695 RepID=UPI002D7A405A|nr:uncharacterized protein LOC133891489 isoform X2 [Phragmites australis]